MKIPAIINFTDVQEKCFFEPNTPEYKALDALNEEGTWKEYQNQQLGDGVSVRFDQSSNCFVVQPDKFFNNKLVESYNLYESDEEDEEPEDDGDIDIEADDEDLDGLMSDEEPETEETIEEPIEEPTEEPEEEITDTPLPAAADWETSQNTEPSNNNAMQVVSIDDVMALIQQVMGNTPAAPAASTPAPTQISPNTPPEGKGGPLQGGAEALKKVFFQGDGNETLDSDFDVLYDNIHNLESHTNPESSYVSVIGGKPKSEGTVEQPGIKAAGINDPSVESVIEPAAQIIGMDDSNPSGCLPDMTKGAFAKYGQDQDPGYYEDMEDGLQGPERLISGLPGSDVDEPEYDFDREGGELLLDIEEEEDPTMELEEDNDPLMMEDGELYNPDLERFGTTNDYSPEEESFESEFTPEDMTPAFEEPQTPAITANQNVNLGGQQVQIILTGVMITVPEMKYIGESVKKAGNRLKQIKGKDNTLNIVVEANDQQYTINYVEPKNRNVTKTPFSIKNQQFTSLEEALERINYKRGAKEQQVFNKIIGADIMSREINNINEATIFDDFKNLNVTSSWTVKQVGSLNLKNGLNEVFSKITQSGNEPNTLVKESNGNFYLIKGNLKERSKVGTKKELVDMNTKKSIGEVEVVGLFENTQQGLGEIMYTIKRTGIPLLVWK